ncbi:MAG TPA: hypothetical protein VFI73_13270 [Candidatus Nitrosopolaris sp.]|nr:hypothetical protein [Candidatus Nitrosopolaris sp.]
MDSIILLVTAIGASLTIVLFFNRTVLSIKWWKRGIILGLNRNRDRKQRFQYIKESGVRSVVRSKPRSHSLEKLKQTSNWNELINKKVNTCEMIYIGRIVDINGHSMTIRSDSNEEYAIATYWIREYDQERAVIDTSIRYLDHYQVKSTTV